MSSLRDSYYEITTPRGGPEAELAFLETLVPIIFDTYTATSYVVEGA